MKKELNPSRVLFTLGHSTRSLEELLEILRAHGVRRLVDVRSIPRSRHNPQFNRDSLSRFLRNRRIGYRHMKSLGGLRHARPDSPNMGWRNASFRGFADYMGLSPGVCRDALASCPGVGRGCGGGRAYGAGAGHLVRTARMAAARCTCSIPQTPGEKLWAVLMIAPTAASALLSAAFC